jgi:hypothetical protein
MQTAKPGFSNLAAACCLLAGLALAACGEESARTANVQQSLASGGDPPGTITYFDSCDSTSSGQVHVQGSSCADAVANLTAAAAAAGTPITAADQDYLTTGCNNLPGDSVYTATGVKVLFCKSGSTTLPKQCQHDSARPICWNSFGLYWQCLGISKLIPTSSN